MKVLEAIEFIFNTNGKFFSVKFRKRSTGEIREMVCRLGVIRGVTGAGHKFDPDALGLITVWDALELAFRMIPVEGLLAVKCGGDWLPVGDMPIRLAA